MSKGTVVTANVNYILENKIKILKGLPLIEISKLTLHSNNIKSHPQEQINNLKKLIQMCAIKDGAAKSRRKYSCIFCEKKELFLAKTLQLMYT